jgi:ubiquitin-protein ligase
LTSAFSGESALCALSDLLRLLIDNQSQLGVWSMDRIAIDLEELIDRPCAGVGVLVDEESRNVLLLFVRLSSGLLRDAVLVFRVSLPQDFPNHGPELSGLSYTPSWAQQQRDNWVSTRTLRDFVVALKATLEQQHLEGIDETQAAQLVHDSRAVFDKEFSSVYIPSEESIGLVQSVKKKPLEDSRAFLTASQLFSLSSSGMSLSTLGLSVSGVMDQGE